MNGFKRSEIRQKGETQTAVLMKTVIVYYSFSGNNESLAKELRLRFGCDIIKIIEQKRRTGFTILLDLIFNRESKILEPDIFLDEYK